MSSVLSGPATAPLRGGSLPDGYSAALDKLDAELAAGARLKDEKIQIGWQRGHLLWEIAEDCGLHYREVMDRVRALGLAERSPDHQQTLKGPLDPVVLAH